MQYGDDGMMRLDMGISLHKNEVRAFFSIADEKDVSVSDITQALIRAFLDEERRGRCQSTESSVWSVE